jgi:hypothetical protein
VRLLRPDAPGTMQAAAAGALCLLAAKDPVVQDSVRYLGGIELLVDMLAAPKTCVAKTARWVQSTAPCRVVPLARAARAPPRRLLFFAACCRFPSGALCILALTRPMRAGPQGSACP